MNPSSQNPSELLAADEFSVPTPVMQTREFLRDLKVWHVFSRNPPVRSCKDAANNRYRLGCRGIPLSDEMKSFFGLLECASGNFYVAIHSRGDREIDLDRIPAEVGLAGKVTRLSPDELARLGMAYGLVNPFGEYILDSQILTTPIIQLFDADLLHRTDAPGTVMTNAGDLTWAVEFDATILHQSLSNRCKSGYVRIVDVSIADSQCPRRLGNSPRLSRLEQQSGRGGKVTLITGNAPESGLRLAQSMFGNIRIAFGTNRFGDVSMPETDIVSIPGMGLSMELDIRADAVWNIMRPIIERAIQSGTKTIAIACHTTQYFAPQIRELCDKHSDDCRFVSMAEVTATWLRKNGFSRVGLIGIRYVADLDSWSAYREPFREFDVVAPDKNTLARISELAYRVKTDGVTQAGITRLRDLIKGSVDCNDILLALTELSLLREHLSQKKGHAGKNLIDPLEIYAQALASRFVFGDAY